MKTISLLLSGLFLLSTAGCESMFRGFQPPPIYEAWVKPGADETEVRKKLLECGKPDSVSGGGEYERNGNIGFLHGAGGVSE